MFAPCGAESVDAESVDAVETTPAPGPPAESVTEAVPASLLPFTLAALAADTPSTPVDIPPPDASAPPTDAVELAVCPTIPSDMAPPIRLTSSKGLVGRRCWSQSSS